MSNAQNLLTEQARRLTSLRKAADIISCVQKKDQYY